MNEFETKPMPVFTEDSPRSVTALQGQVTTLLLATVVLSGILTVYLYIQQRFAFQDRETNKQLFGQFVQVYKQQQKPFMDSVVERLREYGRKDPAFLPVLGKYGYGLPAANAAPAPSAPAKTVATLPAPATAPKK